MSKRYSLRSRFEHDGVFWSPSDNEKFAGHLSVTPQAIELHSAATIEDPEVFFRQGTSTSTPSLLHGLLRGAFEQCGKK